MSKNNLPILFSFRRCPYAMRARLAILSSGLRCELREVVLRDKPAEMVKLSAKATVPVLLTASGEVIDESLDIMLWAWSHQDPENCFQQLTPLQRDQSKDLIITNDGDFKYFLDRYKYTDRYPEHDQVYYRQQGERFLQQLEQRLQHSPYLFTQQPSWADFAIWPFIRQFAFVDKNNFDSLPYPALRNWLQGFLESDRFAAIMYNYPQWHTGDSPTYFP